MSWTDADEIKLAKLMQQEAAWKEEQIRLAAKEDYNLYASTYLKIVNKEKKQCALNLNSVQREINDLIEDLNKKGIPVRIIILKARQEGVSTFFQGRIMFAAATKENVNGLVVAHRDDSTSAIFEKSKYMYDNLPEEIKPIKKASNAKELIFDTPSNYTGDKKGLNSRIRIQTAGSAGIGRSDTFNYAHLSEFGLWEGKDDKSPANQLSGIMDAIPDVPGTEVIIESTAFGFNDFKTIWDDAVAGKNIWVPLFFPWWKHDEYVTEFRDNNEKDEFIRTMSEYEKYLLNDLDLSLERVNWWRNKLKSKNNNINTMKQENPTTPDEAFIYSGTPIFNTEKIIQHKAKLENYYKTHPYKQGEFIITWNNPDMMDYPISYKWTNKPTGCIKIYEDVKPGYPYVVSGDTKGEGSDRFAGTVINNNSGVRCSSLHWPGAKSKYYTAQMWALGMYFNMAVIGIETNFNTYPIELLTDWHYPRQYQRETKDKFTGELKKSYGWKTDGNTRPLIIEKEITVVEEDIDLITDIETLNEMLTFVDVDGRPDAQSGKHDDLLMSDMIGNDIRGQQSHTVEEVEEDIEDDEDDSPKGSSFFD